MKEVKNRRSRRWILWTLVPAVPTLVGVTVVCVAPVQTYVLKKIVRYAARKAGMAIDVGNIGISFPLRLHAADVAVEAREAGFRLSVSELEMRVRLGRLFRKVVKVESFRVNNLRICTGSYIDNVYVDGGIVQFSADAAIDLKSERVEIGSVAVDSLRAKVRLFLPHETEEEPTEPLAWLFAAEDFSLSAFDVELEMPEDSVNVFVRGGTWLLSGAGVDLGSSAYRAERLRIAGSSCGYRLGDAPDSAGFNPHHIVVSGLRASVDSLAYSGEAVGLVINELEAEERSGLRLSSLRGIVHSDGRTIRVPELEAATPFSSVSVRGNVPLSVLEDGGTEEADGTIVVSAGKSDMLMFFPELFGLKSQYADVPLIVDARIRGNMNRVGIELLNVRQSGTFDFQASGTAFYPLDSLRRKAEAEFTAVWANPRLELVGKFSLLDDMYSAEVEASESARGRLSGYYSAKDSRYELALAVDSLEPGRFVSMDSSAFVAVSLNAEGRGLDVFADSTWINVNGRLLDLRYGKTQVRNVLLDAALASRAISANLTSENPIAAMSFDFDGRIGRNRMFGMLSGSVDSLNLEALGLIDNPFSTSFQMFAEMRSDMRFLHNIDVTLGNWEMNVYGSPFRAKTLTLHAEAGVDTTRLSFHAGDMGVVLTGGVGLEKAAAHVERITETVKRLIGEDSMLNISAIQPLLPEISLSAAAGRDNPVSDVLKKYNVDFDRFFVEARTSPVDGIYADAGLYSLYKDTFRIDTIRAEVRPMVDGLTYRAEVIKNRYRRQSPFTAEAKGSLVRQMADVELLYRNNLNKTGLHLGVRGRRGRDGIELNFFPDTATLAFNAFSLNEGNYIKYRNSKDIEADVKFSGEGNSMLWIHSSKEPGEAYPIVHAELGHIPLGVVSQGFVDLPSLQGRASGDLQYSPSEDAFAVVGDVHVDDLIYEGGRVGELMLNATYLPLADDAHQVDAHFYRNMEEVSSATATYNAKKDEIKGSLQIDALPLEMFSPFVPQATFRGALNGKMELSGSTSKPLATGFLRVDTADIFSAAVSSRFRLDDKRIEIEGNRIRFDKFNIYASGDNPFVIDGSIDFSNPDRATADLRAGGNRLQLLDARRGPESVAYGKLLADMSTTIKGPLSALSVRGNVRLLGGTNLTYIMQESPLTVEDHLKDLVLFTSFSDSSRIRRRGRGELPQLPVGGMDVLLLVHIDPVVRLSADINPDQSSYVSLEGGGDLSIQYNRNGQMLVNGRYTLSDGKLKYALPVIPLKEFNVKKDSYLQWDGDPFNPILGLAATQRMRTNVSLAGETPRLVDFEVGVDVRDRLENMSLMFTIAAPDDAGVQSELDKMGTEGRSTQAVGMMVTGLYLAGGSSGKSGVNMSDALNSVLRSGITSIAGSALKSIDISFGMDTYELTPELGGGQRTDYSFRFAKRFLEDRLRIAIGGKVSSGNVQQKEAFIDNASVEWRVNKSGTGNLRLFHDRKFQSILDGEITETGAGIVFRRKMLNLSELFK
ncbi:MAG: translocation/assembly module TamB domain-containing protein [Tannerellaceae bacterium]|nr:translocation/assembly module TamB domain-containing protein [Tannerellaceae bacterium]